MRYVYLAFNLLLLVITGFLITITIRDVIQPNYSAYGAGLLFGFSCFLVPNFAVSIFLLNKRNLGLGRFLPTLLIVSASFALLISLNSAFQDRFFFQRLPDYRHAVQLVTEAETVTQLPTDLSYLSIDGTVDIERQDAFLAITFLELPGGSEGYNNGYFYITDSAFLTKMEDCLSWREINPPIEAWYYCNQYQR